MSFHILHLFDHGSYLSKQRGRLVCKQGGHERSLPIENIKAIIVAARGISFSSQLLGALLEQDCIVLHCDSSYKPVGITAAMARTINRQILDGQITPRRNFNDACWKVVLRCKIANQLAILDAIYPDGHDLQKSSAPRELNEALVAKMYFHRYFSYLNAKGQKRSHKKAGWLNLFLNYGYAVLNTLVHRSIVVHGLLPHLGIHHRPRYGSWPLVYDLMEPWRPVVDGLTAIFAQSITTLTDEIDISDYGRFIGNNLRDFRISHKRYSLKLVDAIDYSVRSFANACISQESNEIWVPDVPSDRYQIF